MKSSPHWKKIGMHPHHGICIPLFSLHSINHSGSGEFLDLIPLIKWCKKVGFDCLQLLPLNDTGDDLSPYNPISSCALDPVYLSIHNLPHANTNRADPFPRSLNAPIPRNQIKKYKLSWLREYFKNFFPIVSKSPEYHLFLSENLWVNEYAQFMSLKEFFHGIPWKTWPASLPRSLSAEDFYCFVQYLCFCQMKNVRDAASHENVFLIGDLPYLLSPDSADVWARPSYFCLEVSAGAPPDAYNPLGQNWGFPLFDWNAMEKSGFDWWKRRLATLPKLFHLYRIDHVVGLFRIWAIQKGKAPTDGMFIPSDTSLWEAQGRKVLEMMLDTCPLLPIAEDLGTIPPVVYSVLNDLGICGTKVLRWQEAISTDAYEPFGMTTVSTPDMESLALWWQKFPEEAAKLCKIERWNFEPTLSPQRQIEILRQAHQTSALFHVNLLQEYLYPFTDLRWPNPEMDRINTPGSLTPSNWTYRFRPSLEQILTHEPLADMIALILNKKTGFNEYSK